MVTLQMFFLEIEPTDAIVYLSIDFLNIVFFGFFIDLLDIIVGHIIERDRVSLLHIHIGRKVPCRFFKMASLYFQQEIVFLFGIMFSAFSVYKNNAKLFCTSVCT